ncbi:hypothetical protein PLUTE_a3156 [Pseudoalteromonas luteoviolacea DSM 6061]|nr:hypothetical protein [Pseudoalteromonas luteoviolacea DSM 6061]
MFATVSKLEIISSQQIKPNSSIARFAKASDLFYISKPRMARRT